MVWERYCGECYAALVGAKVIMKDLGKRTLGNCGTHRFYVMYIDPRFPMFPMAGGCLDLLFCTT